MKQRDKDNSEETAETYAKVNGTWVETTPYVKQNGIWYKSTLKE